MIKVKIYRKITKKSRNLPEKSLKISRRGSGGGSGFAGPGGLANFVRCQGVFWLTPVLAMPADVASTSMSFIVNIEMEIELKWRKRNKF